MRRKKPPALDRVLQCLVLLRMFLLLAALSAAAIGARGYLSEQTLENRQHQMTRFMARLVDGFLDQATRILDAAARAVDVTPPTTWLLCKGF